MRTRGRGWGIQGEKERRRGKESVGALGVPRQCHLEAEADKDGKEMSPSPLRDSPELVRKKTKWLSLGSPRH